MPSTCCCVPNSHNRGGHEFPTEKERREKWIVAINRLDVETMKNWIPSASAVVCKSHFRPEDNLQLTKDGRKRGQQKLLSSAVPTLFQWTKPKTPSDISRSEWLFVRESRKRKRESDVVRQLEVKFSQPLGVIEEIVPATDDDILFTAVPLKMNRDCASQTEAKPMFDIDNFVNASEGSLFYNGLENNMKFMFVLNTLGPAAFNLTYLHHNVISISIPNQLFITLMKLRKNMTHFELSKMFNISEGSVKNVVYTWILFMSKQWREIDIWPSRNLVRYFSPSDFKSKFPTTRVVIDGTECPIKKPKASRAQQATYSTYKNRNTVKTLIGASPGGVITYISPLYGGSTSDRQIVERSALFTMCDPGDFIMADKGFNVRD